MKRLKCLKGLQAGFLMFGLMASVACSTENDNDIFNPTPGQNVPGGGGGSMGGNSSVGTNGSISGLTDFDIAMNTAALSESETIPTGNSDYVENASFAGTISIAFSGNTATVSGDTDGVTSVQGGDVTVNASKAYDFVLTGTATDGSLTITSEKAVGIHLNGVNLTNPDGAAINIQSKVTAYVVATDGTENKLTDGSRTDDDLKVKGAFFSKGKAIFSGNGTLAVQGNYRNGINTKKNLIIRPNTNISVALTDTIQKGSCLKCENEDAGQGMFILGGVLNLSNPTVAGKGLSADGDLTIQGGRVTAICTGAGLWDADEVDVSGSAGIKCDSTFTLKGGDLWLKSTGNGGKGINGDKLLSFEGGTVHVITTGQAHTYSYNGFTYDTSPKGIKCDGNINVSGGELYVRATGTSDGSEGIEAKQQYNQTGGTVQIYAADDALNTGYSSESLREKIQMGYDMTGIQADQGQINVSGGTLLAYSESNDGMDSNGYISISGGNLFAYGAGAPETCFDCDENSRLSVTGGTLFGLAGASPNTPGAACTQCFAVSSASVEANQTYTVKASDGTEILTVTVPRTYSNAAVVVSSPKMAKGETYTIGNSSFTTSTSSWITSNGPSGMGGGGMGPR